jgi:hypothetical protein
MITSFIFKLGASPLAGFRVRELVLAKMKQYYFHKKPVNIRVVAHDNKCFVCYDGFDEYNQMKWHFDGYILLEFV